MPTPVISLRATPAQASLLRKVAGALKADPAVARRVESALAGRPAPTGTGGGANLGPFADEESALAFLRDRLTAALDPVEIRLFGSRAFGSARPDSDFDLLVILPDDADVDHDRAYAPVLGSGIGCDVVPCTLSDYMAERGRPGTVCAAAAAGRALYRKE